MANEDSSDLQAVIFLAFILFMLVMLIAGAHNQLVASFLAA